MFQKHWPIWVALISIALAIFAGMVGHVWGGGYIQISEHNIPHSHPKHWLDYLTAASTAGAVVDRERRTVILFASRPGSGHASRKTQNYIDQIKED